MMHVTFAPRPTRPCWRNHCNAPGVTRIDTCRPCRDEMRTWTAPPASRPALRVWLDQLDVLAA